MLEICAPALVAIEKELIEPFSVQAFLTQTGGDVAYRNPVLAFSRESWIWAHQACHLNYYHTMGSSISYNKSLKINKKSVMSENWVKAGVMLLEDLFDRKHLISFEQCTSKYNTPRKFFGSYGAVLQQQIER